jgi:hypothetical protein
MIGLNLRAVLRRQTCTSWSVARHGGTVSALAVVEKAGPSSRWSNARELSNLATSDVECGNPRRISSQSSPLLYKLRKYSTINAQSNMARVAGTEQYQFNHTMIRVKDAEKSLEFYQVS